MSRPNKPRTIGAEDNLADRITYERSARGWSYETLAREMTEAGCAIQMTAIFRIEKGTPRRSISVDEAIAFSRVFDLSVTDLLAPREAWEGQRLIRDLAEAEKSLAKAKEALALRGISMAGRVKVNDENLQRVAAIVREHPKAHERADATASRDAYAAICAEFNLGATRTAQLWVKRAKDRGMLRAEA